MLLYSLAFSTGTELGGIWSARSLLEIQVLMEALGGGGNTTTAGGYLQNAQVLPVKVQLLHAIDRYFEG